MFRPGAFALRQDLAKFSFVAFAIIGAGIEMQAALTWTEGLQLAKLTFDLGQICDLDRYLT